MNVLRVATYLTHPSVECWNFRPAHAARLVQALPGCEVRIADSEDAFVRELPQAQVALVWRFRQEWFALAPELAWIATPAAGRDYFAVTPPPGVQLTYGTFHGELMAETALAMMLAHARGVAHTIRVQDSVLWPRREVSQRMRPFRGSRVTILGFGHIGEWVGRLAKPFGVRITGVRRHMGETPPYFDDQDRIVLPDHLDKVLPETDHLVLALPSDSGTDKILRRENLRKLPPQAAVYNLGRGNAVDEEALAGALHDGALSGAYLDVFAAEPLPEASPLRKAPNVVLMPHASAVSPNYLDLFLDELVPRIHDWQHR